MAPWRSSSSPRAVTLSSAELPIATTSLNLVYCHRTPASDTPNGATPPATTQRLKFEAWHSAWPLHPQGAAGQE
jgi:hypothetical protein